MHIDFTEIRKCLPKGGGHLSVQLRDSEGRLVVSASLDFHAEHASLSDAATSKAVTARDHQGEPVGEHYLSIIS
jgi:hypothetical protein